MYKDREKPGCQLGPKNCLKGQRILQLKSKICNTTSTRSIKNPTDIGNLIGIERPINIDNIFGNKEVDHLLCGDFEEVDHLF